MRLKALDPGHGFLQGTKSLHVRDAGLHRHRPSPPMLIRALDLNESWRSFKNFLSNQTNMVGGRGPVLLHHGIEFEFSQPQSLDIVPLRLSILDTLLNTSIGNGPVGAVGILKITIDVMRHCLRAAVPCLTSLGIVPGGTRFLDNNL